MTGECAAEQGVPCGCMQWCYYLLPQQLSWGIVGGGGTQCCWTAPLAPCTSQQDLTGAGGQSL